jgi:uncharacterized membrane protein
VLVASRAAAQPTYRVVEIAATQSSFGPQVDPTGTYVAGEQSGSTSSGQPSRVFLWTAAGTTLLAAGPDYASFDSGSRFAVNASGEVVGAGERQDGSLRPYRWTAGARTLLQVLAPDPQAGTLIDRTVATAINASGQAAGYSNTGNSAQHAVTWMPGSSAVVRLPSEFGSAAYGINDAGVIVGESVVYPSGFVNGFSALRATRWANGQLRTFEPPAGYTSSSATDINNAGQIVGVARTSGRTQAMLWTEAGPVTLPVLRANVSTSATGINAAGSIVGSDNQGRALLWQGGTVQELTQLLDAASSAWRISQATSISDDGKIGAQGCLYSSSGQMTRCRAVLLVPTPPAPPVPAYTRYLAEGATSGFFDTQIALLNPGATVASVTLQYLPSSGAPIAQAITVPARTRLTIDPKLVPGLASAEFSTVVQSSQELVVDRTMSWDGTGYGSHSETAVKAPATTWYLAEGATIGGFDLFYLLQNPAATPTTVSVRYLRGAGAPLTKSYALPANSRTNIWVNVEDFPGLGRALAAAEFSAVIESQDGTPIIVERAMYRSNQGRTFNAGHESTGVSTPSTDWFLAEGATGDYFDMFVLLANPTTTDAQVTVTYLTVSGTTYSRTLVAPANSRSGIWVDQEEFPGVAGRPLADVAVSTTVQSTNGVPLVVERAMWWPGDSSTWHEAHNSAGATVTGTKWAVAEGEVGGTRQHETYFLIANTSPSAGSATVTLMFDNGTTMVKTYALPPSSRTNVAVGPDFGAAVTGRRFGAVVESTGTTPAQIVVERAMYSSGFSAGTNALATRLQ